ncbi:MAG: hypothetical protein A2557_00710 [Candidatus Lambdaproteobacteria bacterium RIFOXYD2_FULL_56_26]|uniref:Uncharacterized protein n=1 Tax=Candidatus Lambdaproteobacteria bacterium RIFOXYD2_FULL_56_26 TaxID=1817773 RepID=A0A1F6GU59_9PROT|nr:MAG: hypothetical protein A2557_00710 [Candidatus Lambdaproteobacteria bacterium RIFOXYD2_FULL_56_26]
MVRLLFLLHEVQPAGPGQLATSRALASVNKSNPPGRGSFGVFCGSGGVIRFLTSGETGFSGTGPSAPKANRQARPQAPLHPKPHQHFVPTTDLALTIPSLFDLIGHCPLGG